LPARREPCDCVRGWCGAQVLAAVRGPIVVLCGVLLFAEAVTGIEFVGYSMCGAEGGGRGRQGLGRQGRRRQPRARPAQPCTSALGEDPSAATACTHRPGPRPPLAPPRSALGGFVWYQLALTQRAAPQPQPLGAAKA
jgi:hypothetical protein